MLRNADIAAIKALLRKGQHLEAQDALLALDASGEANAETQYLLGTIFHRQNHLSEAVQAFKRSLLINPGFTDSAISLSVIYNDTGHYKEAQVIFERAEAAVKPGGELSSSPSVVLDREIAEKHRELGNLYRKLQRFDAAANEYLKAIRLDTNNKMARVELSKVLAQRGQTKLAKIELQNLVRDFPDFIVARIQLALLYYSAGNVVDARIELNAALIKEPQNQLVKMYIAMTEQATESVIPPEQALDKETPVDRNPN